MMNFEFENSLKYTFLFIHLAMIIGSAFFKIMDQPQTSLYFLVSSFGFLTYYLVYEVYRMEKRFEAHLNLIDKAIKESEEFKKGVVKKKSGKSIEQKINNSDFEEVKEFVESELEEKEEDEIDEFLDKVMSIEINNSNRDKVQSYLAEKSFQLGGGKE